LFLNKNPSMNNMADVSLPEVGGSNGMAEKKSRRTRKDQNERDFNCGCGKSYLSYPALYTHLKQ